MNKIIYHNNITSRTIHIINAFAYLYYPVNLLITFRTSLQRRVQALLTACIHACVCIAFVTHYIMFLSIIFDLRTYRVVEITSLSHCCIP